MIVDHVVEFEVVLEHASQYLSVCRDCAVLGDDIGGEVDHVV